MRLAENSLMHAEVADLIASKASIYLHTLLQAVLWLRPQIRTVPNRHLTYNTGPKDSRHPRGIAAKFLTDELETRSNVTADHVFIMPALSSTIDALAWAICDKGDGVLIPQLYYNGFDWDLGNRSNVKIVGVSYHDVPGFSQLKGLFQSDINSMALEAALGKAERKSIRLRALMVSR